MTNCYECFKTPNAFGIQYQTQVQNSDWSHKVQISPGGSDSDFFLGNFSKEELYL